MGTVWRAQHLALGAPVAVKLLQGGAGKLTEEMQRRFAREARAVAAIRGPHVVQILDHGVDEGMPYIVLEYLDGESLEGRLAKTHRLPFREATRIVGHVARALTRAKEVGYIHRDLKPSNIYLVDNGEEIIAKVLDFGLAKELARPVGDAEESALTEIGKILGTPKYMSPEQVRGLPIDHRSDLWSLALIAYDCIVGESPFAGETLQELMMAICDDDPRLPSSVDPSLPPAFDAWFMKAVQRDPEQRFQSARELAEALAEVERSVDPATTVIRPHGAPAASRVGELDITVEVDELAVDDDNPRSGARVAPPPRPSLPIGELDQLYKSTLDLDEMTQFWKGSSRPVATADKVPLKLGDRVFIRNGTNQIGPVLTLEVLQAIRDRYLPTSSVLRRADSRSGAWHPLLELRIVGEDGRAVDVAALAPQPVMPPSVDPAMDLATSASFEAFNQPDRSRWLVIGLVVFALLILALLVIARM